MTTGIIIAGGAAAAGVGILAGGGSDPEPEPESPPTVDPPTGGGGGSGGGGGGGGGGGPTDPPPEPEGTDPVACFDTDPNPPIVNINDAVKFNASCSTADKPLRAQMDDKDRNLPLALQRW